MAFEVQLTLTSFEARLKFWAWRCQNVSHHFTQAAFFLKNEARPGKIYYLVKGILEALEELTKLENKLTNSILQVKPLVIGVADSSGESAQANPATAVHTQIYLLEETNCPRLTSPVTLRQKAYSRSTSALFNAKFSCSDYRLNNSMTSDCPTRKIFII
ncbi:hypothetical protein CEXT_1811 [Caerostris extrusa]|uniref:Uncharacterized protein n=1 Tax=Caerostris extrusa TaxID=172846 RepID=A0AAV4S0W3_CAEEX|nr:hypothetical protein CEXT_1811 [Caerostris extrusa]